MVSLDVAFHCNFTVSSFFAVSRNSVLHRQYRFDGIPFWESCEGGSDLDSDGRRK